MLTDLLTALALVLVIEGVLYALFPAAMIRMITKVAELPPSAPRAVGLVSAVTGVFLVWLMRG